MPKLRSGEEWAKSLRQGIKTEIGLGWNVCCHKRSDGTLSGSCKLTHRAEDGRRKCDAAVPLGGIQQVADPGTPVNVLLIWDQALIDEEADFNAKNQELLRAEANMQSLERRPTGREAEREVRKRIRDFMEGDRTDISLRDEFNNWLFQEDLGFVINTRTGEALFGRLEIGPDRKLTGIDSVMDDAAALGLDLEKVREMVSA